MKVLKINTKSKNYNIYIGHNIISKFNKIIKKEKINFKKTLIIVDKNIPKSFVKKLKSKIKVLKKNIVFLFDASEKNKNLKYVNLFNKYYLKIILVEMMLLICLGGGIREMFLLLLQVFIKED